MQSITKSFIKKGAQLFVFTAVGACIIYFLFPMAIVKLYGKEMPNNWTPVLADISFEEIYKKIGTPKDDVSAKGYQGWAVDYWWGKTYLRIGNENCCALSSKPDQIIYFVYVKGWYKPAYIKYLKLENQ
jgi:hypothetical protein